MFVQAHQIVPQIQTLIELVISATEVDDAECALSALQYLNNRGNPKPVQPLVMDEGSIVAILGTAARSANAALAKEAWELLKVSVGSTRAPSPAGYMALVHALSTSQQFDAAFLALAEMQSLFGTPQNAEELEILSPFSSLRPLVLSLSQLGPAGLDGVSFILRVYFLHITLVSCISTNMDYRHFNFEMELFACNMVLLSYLCQQS